MSKSTQLELGPKELLAMVLQDCGFARLRKLSALAEAVSILLVTSKTSTKKKRTFQYPGISN